MWDDAVSIQRKVLFPVATASEPVKLPVYVLMCPNHRPQKISEKKTMIQKKREKKGEHGQSRLFSFRLALTFDLLSKLS